ncbi:glycosyltransferase [Thalassotalea sp. LPB0316]|uniref:glycosyltransferase n=1 Tax=Thalassotalea sp. LPB0316 TaxID=2769490 RepID=UPI00186820C9|nr:glycosyltransferase [Thalassotalea sp. LPB0316]QOL26503.1 glycosyltransferase [Thalassotalea sp. LPB0316]
MNKKNLLVITKIHPVPWQKTRGTYNGIQTAMLQEHFNVSVLVPILLSEWLKNDIPKESNVRYAWQIHLPVIGAPINGLLLFLSLFLNSWLWMRKQKPDALLACWALPDGLAGCWFAKLFKIPFFLKVHGSDINVLTQKPSLRKQITYVANQAKHVFCVSDALRQRLIEIGVRQDIPIVIYNGVDQALFTPSDTPPTKTILFVGNIKRSKGAFDAVDGFKQIIDKHPQHKLLFIGDGPDLVTLKSYTEEQGLVGKVEFLGNKSHHEIADVLKNCQVLTLPSHAEGVPNVVLEAMSCGVPSVATAVGGIPEILFNEQNGYLCNVHNYQDLANKLDLALNQHWDKQAIIKYAKPFTWQRNIQTLKETFEKYI